MKATLKNFRQSPRKVRLVADLVRGKSVQEALNILHLTDKKVAEQMSKLIQSAVSNAEGEGVKTNSLKISTITVDKGITFKKYRLNTFMTKSSDRARRPRLYRLKKRSSIISLELQQAV